jgi:starch phosphorylase
MEASGTSGMSCAQRVPSLSVLDGWWIGATHRRVTGWATRRIHGAGRRAGFFTDAASLYDKLQKTIVPLFSWQSYRFIDVMLHCIALNGSFFNTHRMLQQYVANAISSKRQGVPGTMIGVIFWMALWASESSVAHRHIRHREWLKNT